MEKRDLWIIVVIFLIVIVTGVLIYLNLNEKIYSSPPEGAFPPFEELPLQSMFCYDSDLGVDSFQEGGVMWGVGDGEVHTSFDYCSLEGDPVWPVGTLFEMYCDGNKFKIKDISCLENSCFSGKCGKE